MRNADESNLMAGDKVLLRQLQPRANKWTAQFGIQQYALIDKCGSSVVIELRGRGNLEIQYTWICIIKETGGQEKSMFLEEDGETDPGMGPSDKEDSRQRETLAAKSPGPVWTRHTPKRFEDFVLDWTFNVYLTERDIQRYAWHLLLSN